MPLNKDIIIRIVLGFIIFVMFVRVVMPVLIESLKKKIPGNNDQDNDIDIMIRRQKEKLRTQYGINTQRETGQSLAMTPSPSSAEIESLYKESKWGGGEFAKRIQNEVARNYSYTLAESKINAFITLAEKRNYLHFLNPDHQKSQTAITNYLSLLMILLIMVEEMRNKDHSLLAKVARKCQRSSHEFMLALQLKILFSIKEKKEINEEKLFSESLVIHQFSEDSIKLAIDSILEKEANLWARGVSHFFEELSLHLAYADILNPLPKIQNKKDLSTAHEILGTTPDTETEEIKRIYKKIAMVKHPDKVGQMKLPKRLEKKAIEKFKQIQEAYELIMGSRKK